MKDLSQSIGVSQQSRVSMWLKNQVVRVGLAESLCTYVMMVRNKVDTMFCEMQENKKTPTTLKTFLVVVFCVTRVNRM